MMIVDYARGLLRFEQGIPVAAGTQELSSPSHFGRTQNGYWALYFLGGDVLVVHPDGAMQGPPEEIGGRLRQLSGDDGRPGDDREAAATLLGLVDAADDPGRARNVPRSPSADTGLPPSYPLSGPRNAPAGHTDSSSGASGPETPPAI